MIRNLLKWSVIFALLAAALAAAAYVYINYYFDLDRYRPELTRTLSSATGARITITRPLAFVFAPEPALVLEGVRLEDGGLRATLGSVRAGVLLVPTWPPRLVLNGVHLSALDLELTSLRWPSPAPAGPGAFLAGPLAVSIADPLKLNIEGARVTLVVPSFGTISAGALGADLLLERGTRTPRLSGALAARRLVTPYGEARDLKAALRFQAGRFDLDAAAARLYGGRLSGDATLSPGGPGSASFRLDDFDAGTALRRLAGDSAIAGRASLAAVLHWHRPGQAPAVAALSGEVDLRGEQLVLQGMDIDRIAERFRQTQQINLVDIGAMTLLGPWGVGVTKGKHLLALAGSGDQAGGETRLKRVAGRWRLAEGIATAQDVALDTGHNLVALRGRIDLVRRRYRDVTLALVDRKGCALVTQRLSGDLEHPVVEKPDILTTLAGPVKNTLTLPLRLLGAKTCRPFYQGRLLSPPPPAAP